MLIFIILIMFIYIDSWENLFISTSVLCYVLVKIVMGFGSDVLLWIFSLKIVIASGNSDWSCNELHSLLLIIRFVVIMQMAG